MRNAAMKRVVDMWQQMANISHTRCMARPELVLYRNKTSGESWLCDGNGIITIGNDIALRDLDYVIHGTVEALDGR